MKETKYWVISEDASIEVAGPNYPSVTAHPDCFKTGVNLLHQFRPDKFLQHDEEIKMVLSQGARFNDVMTDSSISSVGMLVSERFSTFLKQYNLGDGLHKFYEIGIYWLFPKKSYCWLQFVWHEGVDLIDFENTKFYARNDKNEKTELQINSKEEFYQAQKKIGTTRMVFFEGIMLKSYPLFDMFKLPLSAKIIITDDLKNDILNAGFTGMKFSESPIL